MLWSRTPQVKVRILGKRGYYPIFDIEEPRHLFVSRDERVWSAVMQDPLPDDWEIGEVYSLAPEEIRLYAAVTLSEADPWNRGQLLCCNWLSTSFPRTEIGSDLRARDARERLNDSLISMVATAADELWYQPQIKGTYLRHSAGDLEEARLILQGIDMNDQLLLAGLSRLLAARRLLVDGRHTEEAAHAMFTSMGAALEFLRQALSEKDKPELTYDEVYDYVEHTFPYGEHVVEYFRTIYELRVTATHPSSRFGEFWMPPIMMGYMHELPKLLMMLYRHIITGAVPPPEEDDTVDDSMRASVEGGQAS